MTKKRNAPRRRKARPLLVIGAGVSALLSGCNSSPLGNLLAPQSTDMAASQPFGNLMGVQLDMAQDDGGGPFGNLLGPAPQADMSKGGNR